MVTPHDPPEGEHEGSQGSHLDEQTQKTPTDDLSSRQQDVKLSILKCVSTNSEIITDPESPSLQEFHDFLTGPSSPFKKEEVEPIEVFKAELASNETGTSITELTTKFKEPELQHPETNNDVEAMPAIKPTSQSKELTSSETSAETEATAIKKPSTLGVLKQQAVETLNLYKRIAREPSLIIKGTVEVFKDLFYNLPKSFFTKENLSAEQQLNQKGSQALVISEGMGMVGAIVGATLATKVLELSPMVSGIIAPILGHYIAAATSYIVSFVLLARKCEGYDTKKALIAGLKTVRDCFPIAAISYAADAPIPAALVAAGIPPQFAAIIYTIVDTAIFTSIAKIAANTETATNKEK